MNQNSTLGKSNSALDFITFHINYFYFIIASYIPSNPKVANVKILGDLKINKKVNVYGTVIGGTEQASTIQLFMTISKSFDVENDLQAISQSKNEKASNYEAHTYVK